MAPHLSTGIPCFGLLGNHLWSNVATSRRPPSSICDLHLGSDALATARGLALDSERSEMLVATHHALLARPEFIPS